jgi:Sec-independent protein secretion pathway component TatC
VLLSLSQSLSPILASVMCLRYSLQEGDRVVMVQEFADGGDLFNLLHKYGGCLSERIAVQMVLDPFLRVLQVRNACAFLLSLPITAAAVYCNCKPCLMQVKAVALH